MAEPQKPRKRIASAVILFSLTALVILGSFAGAAGVHAAGNPLWQPVLQAHDRFLLALGQNRIGDVCITKERLLQILPQPAQDAASKAAQAINTFAEQTDVPVYLLAVPTSAGIYSDTLPESAPLVNEHTFLQGAEGLANLLSDQVHWIEAESWLASEKDQYIYYRTDPCWTSFGAYCAYRSAIRKLGFTAVGYDRFSVTHFSSDYYGRLADEICYYETQPDLVDLYTCSDGPQEITVTVRRPDGREQFDSYYRTDAADAAKHPENVYFAASEPVLRIETAYQNSKDLLLLCDDFGAAMIPFLLQHYHIVDTVNLELAGDIDWRSMTNGTYSQILILCGADTVIAEDGLATMLAVPEQITQES